MPKTGKAVKRQPASKTQKPNPRIEYWDTPSGNVNYRLILDHAGDSDVLYGTVQGFENGMTGIKTNMKSIVKCLTNPKLGFLKLKSRRSGRS
jgi:hypothetical protein